MTAKSLLTFGGRFSLLLRSRGLRATCGVIMLAALAANAEQVVLVTDVTDNGFGLDAGSNAGLEEGMTGSVCTELTVGDQTRKGCPATFEITTVGPDISWARFVRGSADRVEIGFYVELSENAARDDDPLLLLQKGSDQLDQGDWESAVATFERLLMLDPEDLMAKRALDDAQTRLEEENFRASNEGNVAYWETGIRNGIKESDLTQQVFYARKMLEVRPGTTNWPSESGKTPGNGLRREP